jgi:acetylornithine deacetylase
MSHGAGLSDADLLERLVSFDTTSRLSNLPLADFVSDYLDRPGIRLEKLRSEDGTKANLVVRAGPDPAEPEGLTLSGHMDVVPADEPEWRSAPFTLTRAGDTFVGRGTADMKGFLALAINRLARMEPSRLRRPLALLLTYDEEVGTVGARRFVESAGRFPGRIKIFHAHQPDTLVRACVEEAGDCSQQRTEMQWTSG